MTTALLIMDLQQGILANYEADETFIARVASAVKGARAAGIPVVFVRVAFRPGHPEVSQRNSMFAAIKAAGRLTIGSGDDEIVPGIGFGADDVLVTKKRVSAFTGSDLATVLSTLDVDHVVLAGVATSGVVLSTVREAADRDLRITVLADGCRDQDPETHRVLIDKVLPRQAAVCTIDEWLLAPT